MQRPRAWWTYSGALVLALTLGCQARQDYEDYVKTSTQDKATSQPAPKETLLRWHISNARFAGDMGTFSLNQRKIYLEESLKRAMEPKDFFAAVTQEAKPDFILFGENHAVGAGDLGYSQIIQYLRDAGFTVDCVFFELENRGNTALKRVRTKQIAIKNYIRRFPTVHPRHFLDSFQAHLDAPHPAKLFAVDYNVSDFVEKLTESDLRQGYFLVIERNHSMAAKITTITREESCQNSLYIGGYAHLVGPQSLGALLQKDGFNTFGVVLVKAADVPGPGGHSEASEELSPWVWQGSNWNPPALSSPRAFAPPRSPTQILYKTTIKEVGYLEWNDFDGVILLN